MLSSLAAKLTFALTISIVLFIHSNADRTKNKLSPKEANSIDLILEKGFSTEEKGFNAEHIKVRESTTELHVQVGEKLFVFGKSRGTLDKVKIGMHVLTFAQVPGTEGMDSGFKTVSWKKLKDGSIQIQSAYVPWPSTLTWTVMGSGHLKMEANGNFDLKPAASIGLGFDFPNQELMTLDWNAKGQVNGVWSNNQDGSDKFDPFFLPGIERVNLKFEAVALAIRSETPNLILKVGDLKNQSSIPTKSDLSFLFAGPESSISLLSTFDAPSGLPSATSSKDLTVSPMVLWFDFH
ncbi:hypothetical protein [Algoriphagus sp. AK58]|uniref:hypothetical protein n=1 Tax=Algoriphagus sp. AK58 TaxID=1406877 RepID=UPI0016507EB7|nr:hypothetical protein [Algoriphagus sp. AK58]MBC6367940.1 hypothetical protein [Algoriphagus sp. AK58]